MRFLLIIQKPNEETEGLLAFRWLPFLLPYLRASEQVNRLAMFKCILHQDNLLEHANQLPTPPSSFLIFMILLKILKMRMLSPSSLG